jgi:hypothetical protein
LSYTPPEAATAEHKCPAAALFMHHRGAVCKG